MADSNPKSVGLVWLSGIVVKTYWLSGREVRGSHPGHATILLRSNLGQVVHSHCLTSLLSSKKLGYKNFDWTDLTAELTECVR